MYNLLSRNESVWSSALHAKDSSFTAVKASSLSLPPLKSWPRLEPERSGFSNFLLHHPALCSAFSFLVRSPQGAYIPPTKSEDPVSRMKTWGSTSHTAWSWTPDRGYGRVKKGQNHRHMYTKARLRWVVLSLGGTHLIHSNKPEPQLALRTTKQEKLAGLSWRS